MNYVDDVREINKDYPKRILNEILATVKDKAKYNHWVYIRGFNASDKKFVESFIIPELIRLGFKVSKDEFPAKGSLPDYIRLTIDWSY